MTEITASEANEAVQKVLKKAGSDATFHALALSNPAAAVKEATGKDLPAGFKLRIVPTTDADLTLVLPDVQADSQELSDAELESVAGGRCAGSCLASCAISSTVGLGLPGVGGLACA